METKEQNRYQVKKGQCLFQPRIFDSDIFNLIANDTKIAQNVFMCIEKKQGFLKVEKYSFKVNIIKHSQVSKELLSGRIYFQQPLC